MGRHAAIQTFLLTLTGCSWMLLFLTITLSDHHVFRSYQVVGRVAAHTPPPDDPDPCEACWGAGEDEGHGASDGEPTTTEDPGWRTRLARAIGVAKEEGSPEGANDRGGAGGVGAFYYYTLHTSFTALRLKLRRAQQVAGDVREEVTALEEKISHLHHTLVTHFSPRHNPYGHKSRQLSRPAQRKSPSHTSPRPSGPPKESQREGSPGMVTRENLQAPLKQVSRQDSHNRVFPVVAIAPPTSTAAGDPMREMRSLSSAAWQQRLQAGSFTGILTHSSTAVRLASETHQPSKHVPRTPQTLITSTTQSSVNGVKNGPQSANRTGGTQLRTSRLGKRTSGAATWARRTVLSVGGAPRHGAPEVRRVVSVLVVDGDPGAELLAALGFSYPGLTVHLITSTPSSHPQASHLRLSVHSVTPNTTWAAAYRQVLRHVTTPYVLVAHGAASLSRVSGLGLLVWAVEHLGVWAAGGGLLSPSGVWRAGCLTSAYAHYEVAWERGHLGTAGGCQLCQALEGPFLALTSALHHLGWAAELPTHVTHLDLFLRAAHTHNMMAASCSGALFSLSGELEAPPRASLLSLARQHSLYSVRLPQSPPVLFSCREIDAKCGNPSLALPPCCRQELARLVRFMMDTCEAHGLLCELQEGSLLGALKVGGVMPWERDADITFHTKNYTALEALKDVFDRAGYALHLTDNRWCCVDGRWAGGQGSLSSGRWRAELWSQHAMDSEDNLLAGRPKTRVEFDGSWVAAPSSPGQYVRNRYGSEVYRHAQHWLDTGRSSGWDEYEAGKFLPCSSPAHHACLDQYLPDGNLRLLPPCVA